MWNYTNFYKQHTAYKVFMSTYNVDKEKQTKFRRVSEMFSDKIFN